MVTSIVEVRGDESKWSKGENFIFVNITVMQK